MSVDVYETEKIAAIKDVAEVLRQILIEVRNIRAAPQTMASRSH